MTANFPAPSLAGYCYCLQYPIVTLLLTTVLVGCASVAHFNDNKPINAVVGQTTTVTINVRSFADDDQLVLMPGGPYATNKIELSSTPRMIATYGHWVIVTDGSPTISMIDFSRQPARHTGQITLQDNITAIHLRNDQLFVALQKQGMVILDISKPGDLTTVARFNDIKNVSRIKSYGSKVYALSGQKQLVPFTRDDNTTEVQWRESSNITLPATSTDFALSGNYLLIAGPHHGIGSVALSEPSHFVDTMRLQGERKALQIYNGIAYVADGTGGLVLLSVSGRGKLQWLGSHNKFDTVDDIYVSGDRAFVIDRSVRVATLNVTRKTLPITGSFYKPEDQIVAINVQDERVFVATTTGIEQVEFPLQPHAQISNEGINQGGTRRAYIDKGIAYVADWFSGLHLYDISDPKQPRHIANFHTPGSSKGVVVENGYAYVGDDDHGLQIVDVSNPEQPTKVASLQTTGLAYTLKKVGNLIYLADHRGGFDIIDVSQVNQPVMLASYDTAGKSWAIDVSGDTAFVADDTSGLLVFDVSDPAHPHQIGQFNPQGYAEDVVVKNNRAYVSFFDKGFYILDITTPAQPEVITHIPVPGNARSVDVEGEFAYVAGWESGLNIIDISDPASPYITARYDTKGSAWGADIYKGYAYVWDWWGGVKVIDVSDPRQPKLAGKYHTRGLIHNLRKKGNYAYTANGNGGVQVFDIKNSLNPIWVTGIDLAGQVEDIWPSSSSPYLFAADGEQGLQVLDISNPFYIRDMDRYVTGGRAFIVREYERSVYVANETGSLTIFNARDPRQLTLVQTLPIHVTDMWIANGVVFATSPEQGLLAFDIKDDGKLEEKHIVIHESAERVTANRALLVSAENNKGLSLWQRKKQQYKPLASITIPETVLDMQLDGQDLLVNTRNRGLLVYDISEPRHPLLRTRYPATDLNQRFMIHGDGIFFAGTHTIASVQRLPKLSWKKLNNALLEITVAKDFPLGNYHLMVVDANGNEELWPNALQVSLPRRNKPKMSMEQFKKLYEQHRSQQK